MKWIKRLIVLAAVLIILVVGGIIFALTRIDSIFKTAVEKGGTYALGVKTTLTSADVELTQGKASMSGLDVANPAGYKSDKFFGLGTGSVQVAIPTLNQPVIEVPTLKLSDIRVNLEKTEGKANYQVILDNLAKLSGGQQQPASTGSDKKFIINEVDIRNVVVHVDLIPVGGALTQVNVPIEEIQLKNVGTASKGLPAGELAKVIIKAVLAVATEKGAGIIPADVLGDLQSQLSRLGDLQSMGIEVQSKLSEAGQKALDDAKAKAQQQIDEGKKKVDDAVKDAQKKLEDLIPGKPK
ncbi:MAG: hypothetical protein IT436_00090 [Phycisphaerales bacterium]|nr:hypothetical protein [Phycisphaerales bacterium]